MGFRQAVHTTVARLTFGAAEVAEAELFLTAATALLFRRGCRGCGCGLPAMRDQEIMNHRIVHDTCFRSGRLPRQLFVPTFDAAQ